MAELEGDQVHEPTAAEQDRAKFYEGLDGLSDSSRWVAEHNNGVFPAVETTPKDQLLSNHEGLAFSQPRAERQAYVEEYVRQEERRAESQRRLDAFDDLLVSLPEDKRLQHQALLDEIRQGFTDRVLSDDQIDFIAQQLASQPRAYRDGGKGSYQDEAVHDIQTERGPDATSFGQPSREAEGSVQDHPG